MGKITQPGGSIKLSNVSVVKYKKSGKRFEIACYPNKVREWRNGTEKDLDNVLQITSVYANVSKGQLAATLDLESAFETSDTMKIIFIQRINFETLLKHCSTRIIPGLTPVTQILEKGELQMGEKERQVALEALSKDVSHSIAEKTINPETKRPYTATMIEKILSDIHFNPNPNKTAKQLSLDAIKMIQVSGIVPIARVQLQVRVLLPLAVAKRIRDELVGLAVVVKSENWENPQAYELVAVIEPEALHSISEMVAAHTKGKNGSVELLATDIAG